MSGLSMSPKRLISSFEEWCVKRHQGQESKQRHQNENSVFMLALALNFFSNIK